ncbi:dynamin family protein [Streptomyces sp. H28]|uniref:dynamin family protein n=1 Tax=Streptomyces sp. H28 TaxID=2775865 RepID=UPI003EC74003
MTAQPIVKDPAGPWAPAVAGHLRWVHGLLSGLDLLAEHRDALRSRLWAVRSRADDPELRVAVFGETSSGKSTLLNAFLRRRLLPSSARVTTRTTTVLRHREDAEGLTVRTDEDVVLTWPSQSFDDWAGRTPGTDGGRLEDALHRVLTTDLADRVRGLHVLTDVALLGGDVTVIDTPGFSVTDPGHRELAEEAARQADVALVVVPAVAALSMTLVDFLTGPLRDHHDRCAFVLTKLDLLDEDEHPETVEVVTHRLRELGFTDPVLLPCAPGRALTEALATTPADAAAPRPGPRGPGHLAPFLDVEAEIVRLAADRRRSAVAATVCGLLSDLLAAVEETTDSRRAELSRSRGELAALTLPDLTEFLDGWAGRARDRVGSDPLLSVPPDVPAASREELATAIDDAVAGNKINNTAKAAEEVSRLVRLHLRERAEQQVRAAVGRAGELLTEAAGELAKDFGRQYDRLAGLAGESTTTSPAPAVDWTEPPAPDLSGIDAALATIGATLVTSDNWRTGGGAAAGALVGSMIAPGLGTVIGGVLGAAFGTRSTDATRQQFLDRARPVIAAGHDEIDTLVADCVRRVRRDAHAGIDALRRRYDTTWREEIDRLTAAHDRQLDQLAAAISAAEKAAAAARRRREEVLALRRDTSATAHAPDPQEP